MKDQRFLFLMLVFLVIFNFIRNKYAIANDAAVLIFVIGMLFVCVSFMVTRSKKKIDEKYGKYKVDEVSDEIKELAAKSDEEE